RRTDDRSDVPQHVVSTAGTRSFVVDDDASLAGHFRWPGRGVALVGFAGIVALAEVGAATAAAVCGAVVTGLPGIDDAVAASLERAIRPAAVAAGVVPVVALLAMVDHAVAAPRQRAQEGGYVVDLVRHHLDSTEELTARGALERQAVVERHRVAQGGRGVVVKERTCPGDAHEGRHVELALAVCLSASERATGRTFGRRRPVDGSVHDTGVEGEVRA